jgi:adenylylsulfate kinase
VTGLPGSGKSVISKALIKLLRNRRVKVQLLSSDALRKVVTPRPSYSVKERDMVYDALVHIAKLLTDNGMNVIIDATGNLRRYRNKARKSIARFAEVYLECPLELCMQREARRQKTYSAPREIYREAIKGEARTVPGIGQPYEHPLRPEVAVDTTKCSPEECAQLIFERISGLKWL